MHSLKNKHQQALYFFIDSLTRGYENGYTDISVKTRDRAKPTPISPRPPISPATTMDLAQYRRINTIIERDSADATYKYVLLRGVIEICQQSSHLREEDGDQVSFPARI
jgi:hypothetical protein